MSVKLRPNNCESKPGHRAIAEDVTAAIGLGRFVDASADDHVEPFAGQPLDHRRRCGRVIGRVAIGHDIDVGIDIGEHPADDVALALHPLAADHGAGFARDLDRAVAAVIVVDVDRCGREHRAEARDRLRDRRFLVVAGEKDGNARFAHDAALEPKR
jgi:hypothetical protein